MDWTEPKPPTDGICYYDHVDCDTPLGLCRITWKSWKERPDYDVEFDGISIGFASDLEEAKELAVQHLIDKHRSLSAFLAKETSQP